MPVKSSGQLSLRYDILAEVGGASFVNLSLRNMSSRAGFATPDAMSEFYGFSNAVPYANTLSAYFIASNNYKKTGTLTDVIINLNNSFSWVVWYRNTRNTQSYMFMLNNSASQIWNGSTSSSTAYFRKQGAGQPVFQMHNGGFIVNASWPLPVLNQWNHYALTYDVSTRQLKRYLNGTQYSGTTIVPATTYTSSNPRYFTVGGQGHNNSAYVLEGFLDDLAFYNRRLSDAEIASAYNSGLPDNLSEISGLTEWYRFERNNFGWVSTRNNLRAITNVYETTYF
jgi:hypothetical protein